MRREVGGSGLDQGSSDAGSAGAGGSGCAAP